LKVSVEGVGLVLRVEGNMFGQNLASLSDALAQEV